MENYISIVNSVISAIIGSFLTIVSGWLGIKLSRRLSINEKRRRLKAQLIYLIELYEHNLNVFDDSMRTQEDIDSAIWEPDIFIFEIGYKDYLLYIDLTGTEKQKVLSWMRQWELINKKMIDYFREYKCDRIVAETILRGRCMKQNEQLKKLFPDIKVIVQKIEGSIKGDF